MEGTNPKISFIPKGSLVREESFLERPRPRSVMGLLAIFVFVASVGSYVGLRYYANNLAKEIVAKTDEIRGTQKEFNNAPQVGKAKSFRSRAALAKELLDAHTVVSPALTFLSENTLANVLYNKFSLDTLNVGGKTLELSGEAPSYASLAYQRDVLQKKTKELSSVSIHDVGITKLGTVSFAVTMVFSPDYLSYTKNLNISESAIPQSLGADIMVPVSSTATSSVGQAFARPSSSELVATSTGSMNVLPPKPVVPIVIVPTSQPQSTFGSLWARFKFW